MKKYVWAINVVLILIAVALGGIWVCEHARKPVLAQSSMEVGDIIAIAGQYRDRDDEPLFLMDTKNQVLLVYEYQIQTNHFSLRAVRRYEWDTAKEKDRMFAPIGTKSKVGPKVEDVQKFIAEESAK